MRHENWLTVGEPQGKRKGVDAYQIINSHLQFRVGRCGQKELASLGNQKVLYLDVKDYIELGRRRKAGDIAVESRLKALLDRGAIVIPLAAPHILEASSISKEQQRRDLVSVMHAMSRGWVLPPIDEVMYMEVRQRVAAHYGRHGGGPLLKGAVAVRGYPHAMGIEFGEILDIDPTATYFLEMVSRGELESEDCLFALVATHRPKIGVGTPEHEQFKTALGGIRTLNPGKSLEQMEEEAVLGLSIRFINLVQRALGELGIREEEALATPPKHFWTKEYMATLPTIDVWTKLHVYLSRNPQLNISPNHLYDMAHLALALPYCDVVMCDSQMLGFIQSRKLDVRHSAKCCVHLEDALSALET
ncbi:hypothetical protein KYC5002_02785 [Archangium violaceum]|uniref:hypothetical protein n=1 Tax=Archangium violaceum TaxID=83451 RepID=UPI002B287986|nr:hypothetical protein KYC5002_02785 [Archangium gephyra]